jgi:cold shock CspA family protein
MAAMVEARPMAEGRKLGRIARLDATRSRGFGFIEDAEKTEYFLHKNVCLPQSIFGALVEGDIVSFHWDMADKGPRAVNVKRAGAAEAAQYTEECRAAEQTREENRGNR